MIHRIEIWPKTGFGDPHAAGVLTHIKELGISTVTAVESARLFFLVGDLTADQATEVASQLLVDPVVETFNVGTTDDAGKSVVEVHLQPGVMDPVAASAERAISDMGIAISAIQTGRRYELAGEVTDEQRETIAKRLLANGVIEDFFFNSHTPAETKAHEYKLEVVEVAICDLDDAGLEELSKTGDLFLNLTEMKAIQDYYKALGREPRDVELEMIAQTWSEHCGHKTFRSDVCVKNSKGEVIEEIPNLLKNTVFKSTMDLNKPWCLNVFEDNAGVIEFDDENAVCFKVETHNHPSAIEPYGGSMTGIGGVVRDPMGTGLGAKPIANTDVFCFGDVEMPLAEVPTGVLHPRRVMRGVVEGVRDYGNRMGIPTVNGAVYFDDKYIGNPLVFCGTVAIMPKDKCKKEWPKHGDAIVAVGGRTGRDGIHGATFSSGELTHEHETEFSHAVQIGNAITEKKVLDTVLQARDKGLYSCITDCGAGGLSSAIGEMGERIGATVQLDQVPLKYAGLSYPEIWISEAQERMVIAVPQENIEETLALFASEDVEATVIGQYGVTDSQDKPLLILNYGETNVGELSMDFLHDVPRPTKEALWDFEAKATPAPAEQENYNDALLKILASPNVASKEWVIRQYDHEVQGNTVVKPLIGEDEDAPGNGAVIRPVYGSNKGVAVSCGMNPTLGELDPYESALHAVDEAMRNIVAVGGNVERTAVLDNFCWGNCNKPDRMGDLVQSAKACYDAAIAYEVPFVSGKDSLNNEFQTDQGETIAIPPTLLISAISVVDDVRKSVTPDAKKAGNLVYQIGFTRGELGGSHYLRAQNLETGNDVPPVDLHENIITFRELQHAIEAGLVKSCHDMSEGGLAVAAAEMAFGGNLGMNLSLDKVPVDEAPGNATIEAALLEAGVDIDDEDAIDDVICNLPAMDVTPTAMLFGESAGRFLVEVKPENKEAFEQAMEIVPVGLLGALTADKQIKIDNLLNISADDAKNSWQGTFNW